MTAFLDPTRNFAVVTVSTGYDSAATSIVLASGHGSLLPDPATEGAFNLPWWNSTDHFSAVTDTLKEIVRVTARSGDTLTVTRAQETTSAQNHNIAGKTYSMALDVTRKTFDQIDSKLKGLTKSGFYAYRGTNQTGIVTATETKIQFATEVFDLGAEYDPTTNFRWTIAKTGYYEVVASAYVTPSAVDTTKYWRLRVKKNASTEVIADHQRAQSPEMTLRCVGLISLTAGDFLEVTIEHNMGSNQTVGAGSHVTFFNGFSIYSGD